MEENKEYEKEIIEKPTDTIDSVKKSISKKSSDLQENKVPFESTESQEEQKEKSISKTTIFIIGFIIVAIIIAGLVYSNMTGNITKDPNKPQVLLKTSVGDIIIELYPDKAPITVENFLNYVNNGHYTNVVFHRVIKGFMIQTGGFTQDGKEKPTNPPIKLESDNGLKNELGTIAMARTNVPDSATSQFFINTADNDFLNNGIRDQGYAVFGRVIDGIEVVTKIENTPTTVKNSMRDWPEDDILIISAEIL